MCSGDRADWMSVAGPDAAHAAQRRYSGDAQAESAPRASARPESYPSREFRPDMTVSQIWIGGRNPTEALFVPPPVDRLEDALDDFERFLHEDLDVPILVHDALAHFRAGDAFIQGSSTGASAVSDASSSSSTASSAESYHSSLVEHVRLSPSAIGRVRRCAPSGTANTGSSTAKDQLLRSGRSGAGASGAHVRRVACSVAWRVSCTRSRGTSGRRPLDRRSTSRAGSHRDHLARGLRALLPRARRAAVASSRRGARPSIRTPSGARLGIIDDAVTDAGAGLVRSALRAATFGEADQRAGNQAEQARSAAGR